MFLECFLYRTACFVVITMSEQDRTVSDSVVEDQIQKIKDKIQDTDNSRSLHINRVPKPAHEDFLDLAEAKFADDYGMALAGLIQYFKNSEQRKDELREVIEVAKNE